MLISSQPSLANLSSRLQDERPEFLINAGLDHAFCKRRHIWSLKECCVTVLDQRSSRLRLEASRRRATSVFAFAYVTPYAM